MQFFATDLDLFFEKNKDSFYFEVFSRKLDCYSVFSGKSLHRNYISIDQSGGASGYYDKR